MPVKPWKKVQDVQEFGRKCPTLKDLEQMTDKERHSTDLEDCLNMAIYSPNVRPKTSCRVDIFLKITLEISCQETYQ